MKYYFSTEPQAGCQANQFRCNDGTCIDAQARCNSYPDCYDRSDEDNCGWFSTLVLLFLNQFMLLNDITAESKECGPDEFRCGDGSCIDVRARCNSYPECRDQSDEQNCGESMML